MLSVIKEHSPQEIEFPGSIRPLTLHLHLNASQHWKRFFGGGGGGGLYLCFVLFCFKAIKVFSKGRTEGSASGPRIWPQLPNLLSIKPSLLCPPTSLSPENGEIPSSASLYRQLNVKALEAVVRTHSSLTEWGCAPPGSCIHHTDSQCCSAASQMNVWCIFSSIGSFNDHITPVIPTAHVA